MGESVAVVGGSCKARTFWFGVWALARATSDGRLRCKNPQAYWACGFQLPQESEAEPVAGGGMSVDALLAGGAEIGEHQIEIGEVDYPIAVRITFTG